MSILTTLIAWLEPAIMSIMESVPFIDDGQAFWNTLSKWALRFTVGGGIASYPLYQIIIARYSIRIARRVIRKLLRWIIILGSIGLVVYFLTNQ